MIKNYLIILITSLLVDMFWHIFIAPKLFREQIGHLMGEKSKLYPAIIFYITNAGAILIFVVGPGIENLDIVKTFFLGGFLGFAMYGTYNFTNLALLKNWPIKLTIFDLGWGTFATATTSAIASKIISYF